MAVADAGTAVSRLRLGVRDFVREARRGREEWKAATEDMRRRGERLKSVGQDLTLKLTAPILAAGGILAKIGADVEESENLFRESFGEMSAAARAWSEETGKALGINRVELRRNAGLVYVMVEAMGLGRRSAFDMATGVAELASDFASFYNMEHEDAFAKIRAALVGETEGLRRLGVVLDETILKEAAVRHGIAARGAALTAAQKVQARWAAIVEQTAKVQGDMARTLDSNANKERRLTTVFREQAEVLAAKLQPAWGRLLDRGFALAEVTGRLVDRFAALPPATQEAALGAAAVAAAAGPALIVAGQLTTAWASVAAAVPALGKAWAAAAAVLTGPAGWVAAAAAAALAIRPVREAVFDFAGRALGALRSSVSAALERLSRWWAETREGRAYLAALARVVARDVVEAVRAVVQWVGLAIRVHAELAKRAREAAAAFIKGAASTTPWRIQVELVTRALKILWEWMGNVWERLREWTGGIDGVLAATALLVPGAGKAIAKIREWHREAGELAGAQAEANVVVEKGAEAAGDLVATLEEEEEASGELALSRDARRKALELELDVLNASLEPLARMREELDSQKALLSAIVSASTAEELAAINLAAELGLAPAEALNGARGEYLRLIVRTREAIEESRAAVREYEEGLGSIRQHLTTPATTAGLAGLVEHLSHALARVDLAPVPIELELDDATLRSWSVEYHTAVGEAMTATSKRWAAAHQEMGAVTDQMWRSIQDTAASAIGSMLRGQKDAWAAAMDAVVSIVSQALGRIAVLWAANVARRVAMERAAFAAVGAGGTVGGGFGGLGGIAGSVGQAAMGAQAAAGASSTASMAAMLGPFVVVAAGALVNEWRRQSRRERWTVGSLTIGGTGASGAGIGAGAGAADAAARVSQTLERIGELVGGQAQIWEAIRVDVQANGKAVVKIGNEIVHWADSLAEAEEYALKAAIQSANFAGAQEELVDEYRRIFDRAGSLDEALAMVDELWELEQSSLDPATRAVRAFGRALDEFHSKVTKFGLELSRTADWVAREWEKVAREISSPEELEAARRELAAVRDGYQTELNSILETMRQLAAVTIEGANEAISGLDGVGRGILRLGGVAGGTSELLARRAEELEAILAALPSPEDLAITATGGRRGNRRDDQRRLGEALDDEAAARLGPAQRAWMAFLERFEGYGELVRGNAELQARLNAEMVAAGDALRKQIASDFYTQLRDFERGTGPGSAPTRAAMRANAEQAERLRAVARDTAAALGLSDERLARMLERIDAAEAREAARIADRGLAGLLGGMAEVIQNEELRHELLVAQWNIEHTLKMEMWRAEFQALQALGHLTDKQVAQIQAAFDWIDTNFDAVRDAAVPPPGPPAPPPDDERRTLREALREARRRRQEERERANELLEGIALRGLSPFRRGLIELHSEFRDLVGVLGRTPRVLAMWRAELSRFVENALASVSDLRRALSPGGALSVSTSLEQYERAKAEALRAAAAFEGGDLSKLEEIPGLVQRVIELDPAAAAGAASRELRTWADTLLAGVEAVARQTAGAVDLRARPDDPVDLLIQQQEAARTDARREAENLAKLVAALKEQQAEAAAAETRRAERDQGLLARIANAVEALLSTHSGALVSGAYG